MRLLFILAIFLTPAIGIAEKSSAALLSRDEMSQIAGTMFESYRYGRVNQMARDENDCWEDSTRLNKIDSAIIAGCATAAIAGGLIEASYARSQRRSPHPKYTGDAIRDRIMVRSRLSSTETQNILDITVRPNIDAIISGLSGAGMR